MMRISGETPEEVMANTAVMKAFVEVTGLADHVEALFNEDMPALRGITRHIQMQRIQTLLLGRYFDVTSGYGVERGATD